MSARLTWRIENFTRLNTRMLYSESFYVGGYKWRVLIFPKGDNDADHLAIYLDVTDSATLPYGWSKHICFSLSVTNHIDNQSTVKKVTQHLFHSGEESDWGFTSFMPLSELYNPGRGFIVNDTCVIEVDFPHFPSVELKVEAAKAASAKGETPKSSQGDIDGSTRQTTSGIDTILLHSDTLDPPPASKSDTTAIKTSVPPIVEKESMVNSPQSQVPEVELTSTPPMDDPLESASFDDVDDYIFVETDAPFDSITEGLVAASTPQSTIDEAKKFFIKMLSRDLSEIPDFAAHITKSICVLSECCDLTSAQLAQLKTLKVDFPTVLKSLTSNHSLKEVEEKVAEKQGTKKSLVEQIKSNAFALQMQRAIQKGLIAKEAELQQELAKIFEKKKSAEKEIEQLHEKMVNLEQSRSSVLEEIATLETEKTNWESSLSWVQQKWTELRHIFMEPNN
ncbi:uncharacterized protein LOC132314205 [Cornus florida]|uniref:uncharacterized protein LOC132314205 n=1 Tax=Cornus florida TaxID=4283 RepID=UPI0028A1BFA1|nr:uncharacterized protein LOC132314205 [Cornus florida]